MRRNYSQETLKILFALSGGECASPGCNTPVIALPTETSNARVIGEICHINALNPKGPRGTTRQTEAELNAVENLIVLCPTHHTLVDRQPETYTTDLLRSWKQTHETTVANKRLSTDSNAARTHIFSHHYFPVELVDQKINEEVELLRKSRFFLGFDGVHSALSLARMLVGGELSGGTKPTKSKALAWCARLLSSADTDKAEELLTEAKRLGACPEIQIADAFVASQKGDVAAALKTLAVVASSASRSASFMVAKNHYGPQGALDWLKTVGMNATNLDPEGKLMLLAHQLHLGDCGAAMETIDAVSEDDLCQVPALRHMVAMAHLLSTVPAEFCEIVFNHVPLNAANFPLYSDVDAIDARRTAHRHFVDAVKTAQELSCPEPAWVDDEYALWLELRDPEYSESGRQRLLERLSDLKSTLRLVPLGLQFGIKLDLAAVEQEIERQIALHGGMQQEAEVARFVLFITQKPATEAAQYLAEHEAALSGYLGRKAVRLFQIECLAQAGSPEKANEYLELLVEEGLPQEVESRLKIVIAEAKGTDSLEALRTQFEQTGALADLIILAKELEKREEWKALCKYGALLFSETRSVPEAERLAIAFYETRRTDRLVELLESNPNLLAQSRNLQMLYCSALFYEGDLLKARSELAKLSDDGKDGNYRALRVNLAIALGDWNSLAAFVADEYQEKENRSAGDLIRAAQLSLCLNSPHAKQLILAVADKAHDDADALTAAYALATKAGWEHDVDAIKWLHRAFELSGNNGPIQQITLKDILDRRPAWDRQEARTWQLLSRGEIPMTLAAQSLNRSLLHLMLFPALANLSEPDPRRRGPIPAYSGKRQSAPFDVGGTVGMDVTTLLTLSLLDILGPALDAFDTVYVPHSALGWLFQEKDRAAFHQPSRIRDAYQLRDLLATGALERWVSSTPADSDLAAHVGDELSMLITEAENVGDDADTQRVVVQPAPVYRPASLMDEEADLTEHAAVISSCLSIVDKLRKNGQITAEEDKRARAYFQLQEKSWPQQPEIADGAILYLSSLTVTHFLHLGLLEKLRPAGFTAVASPREVSEADELIAYEGIAKKVREEIENVRSALSQRIESGKIRFGRSRHGDEPEERPLSAYPIDDLLALRGHCETIIADDRFFNQHERIEDNGSDTFIFSTLDLLDWLTSADVITPDSRLEYRTRLRQAGYFFAPVEDVELTHHLNASPVQDDNVIETAELKAIRENILCVRMSEWLQLPHEVAWLDTTLHVLIRVLKGLWQAGTDLAAVTARSNWIVELINIRGWAHRFGVGNEEFTVKAKQGLLTLTLFTPPSDASQEIKNAYWNWVEDRVLLPIKEQDPDLYAWIVEQEKSLISQIADREPDEWKRDDE